MPPATMRTTSPINNIARMPEIYRWGLLFVSINHSLLEAALVIYFSHRHLHRHTAEFYGYLHRDMNLYILPVIRYNTSGKNNISLLRELLLCNNNKKWIMTC